MRIIASPFDGRVLVEVHERARTLYEEIGPDEAAAIGRQLIAAAVMARSERVIRERMEAREKAWA